MDSHETASIEEAYDRTIAFLYSLERFGILLGLENITRLLDGIGNPQRRFAAIHVAGSNGKGSTASFVHSILREAGLRTALYTSPHLNDFRERIRIDGALVSKEALVASARRVREVYDPERTTFFELTTALAFDCIARNNPDLAVIEVGLGGRLDATNMAMPKVCVITDISREHEDYLGVGIASVAREKAGIIKHGVPLITGASRADARDVILETARASEATVKEFGRDFTGIRGPGDRFTYQSDSMTLPVLVLGMAGSYQVKNASLAIAVVEELILQGYAISEEAIREGIARARFPGRFEVLRREPDVIIDGAHTVEGMRFLVSTVRRLYPGKPPLVLLGMLGDKDVDKLAPIICGLAREVVCVRPQGDRALDPERLADIVRQCGTPAESAPTVIEGFQRLMERASKDDLVLATGSLYMIGPVRRACGVGDEEFR